ncbi:MAG: T9SS type A sorting domain-containing protein, partial [Bacteroidetes bacterium]|nr:T9SS type A sorting domain-containing protein [Bacteroidota bacterium]
SAGGHYCEGVVPAGIDVILDGSEVGITYELFNNEAATGQVLNGTGSALNFILQLAGHYTIIAYGCNTTTDMSGTSVIVEDMLPVVFNTTGGGSYCYGGNGVSVGLDGSETGILYTLYLDDASTGITLDGSGLALDFGMITTAGIYTVKASNNCGEVLMNASATVVVNPVPFLYNVTGGGHYCEGENGVHVGLDGSETGVVYELHSGGMIQATLTGDGNPLDFGLFTSAGVYMVKGIALNLCGEYWMSGGAIVTVDALPIVFNVTGGGTYCFGGEGLAVGLDGSEAGATYMLLKDGVETGDELTGTGEALDFGLQLAGVYTIKAATCGEKDMAGEAIIIENTQVIANAGPTVIIDPEVSLCAQLLVVANGGTPPYTYLWAPAAGLSDATLPNPEVCPDAKTLYTVVVTDALGCTGEDNVLVKFKSDTVNIFGTLTYDGNSSFLLDNVTVELINAQNEVVVTTTTNLAGEYEFLNIEKGSYTLHASSNATWGGGNGTDAQLIIYHFVGREYLTGLPLLAADVNGDGAVNSLDALLVMKRFVELISGFAAGDWVFETVAFTHLYGGDYQYDFHGICYGDVNKSFVPGLKMQPSVTLENQGVVTMNTEKETVLPVNCVTDLTVGSVSFVMSIPDFIEVKDIVFNGNGTSVFNRTGNQLKIAWYSAEPLQLKAGGTLLSLVLTPTQSFDQAQITMDGTSVLSDETGGNIQDARLCVSILAGNGSSSLSVGCYPNPVNNQSVIMYNIPEDGNTSLRLYTVSGVLVNELANGYQTTGCIIINLDATTLTSGVYFLRLEHNGQIVHKMLTVSK